MNIVRNCESSRGKERAGPLYSRRKRLWKSSISRHGSKLLNHLIEVLRYPIERIDDKPFIVPYAIDEVSIDQSPLTVQVEQAIIVTLYSRNMLWRLSQPVMLIACKTTTVGFTV